jgi:hypothetical protein
LHVVPGLKAHGETQALVHRADVRCGRGSCSGIAPPLNRGLITDGLVERRSDGLFVRVDAKLLEEGAKARRGVSVAREWLQRHGPRGGGEVTTPSQMARATTGSAAT